MRAFFRDRKTLGIIGGTVVCIAAAATVLGGAFIVLGGVNVAANTPDNAIVADLLHYTFKRSVAARSEGIEAPADLSSDGRVRLGAQHYAMVCSKCHGVPGLGQNPVPLSMNPRPQYLPAVLGQFSDPELHWIVQHGVSYSAMPAWVSPSRGDEVWSIVAFLKAMPSMSPSDYLEMTAAPKADAGDAIPYGEPGAAEPSDVGTKSPPLDEFAYTAPAAEFSAFAMTGDPLPTCARCHGPDGSGGATGGEAPNLTLQNADYLKAALTAYARGQRKSGYMQTVASQLSKGQIDALAAHYAGLPAASGTTEAATQDGNAGLLARGKAISENGLPEAAVPGCTSCHNDGTTTGSIAVPQLAGQSAVYLRRQLAVFRAGGRGSTGPYNPMGSEAHRLTDADIDALAAYYASLPPTKSSRPPSIAASAESDTRAEEIIGRLCVTCHTASMQGIGTGVFPNVTLQTPDYVAQALRAYREGTRPNSQMNLVGRDLKDEDISALAAYIGGLPATGGPVAASAVPDPAAVARGAVIASQGIPDREVPACLTCHSAEETEKLPLLARLHGQNSHYLAQRLDYFTGPLANGLPNLNPMPAIARRLTDQERADVAAWFAAQSPLPKTLAAR